MTQTGDCPIINITLISHLWVNVFITKDFNHIFAFRCIYCDSVLLFDSLIDLMSNSHMVPMVLNLQSISTFLMPKAPAF
jgi:hypothetical protein